MKGICTKLVIERDGLVVEEFSVGGDVTRELGDWLCKTNHSWSQTFTGMADRRRSGAVVQRGRSRLSTSRHQRARNLEPSSGEEDDDTKKPKVEERLDEQEEEEEVEQTRRRSGIVRARRSVSRERRKEANSEVPLQDNGPKDKNVDRYTTQNPVANNRTIIN